LKFNVLAVSVLSFASVGGAFAADAPALAPEVIVQNYCAARLQSPPRKTATMEMDIQASLPRQKKQGRFHALRKINPFGRVSYSKQSFEGDTSVRNEVVKRFLEAEADAQQDEPSSVAVTPENYKFQFKGSKDADGRSVYVFQLSPRHKRKGLFKGEIWIDAASYLPVRESGSLIKSPSIFVRKVAFVRTFDIRDGVAVPLQVQSTVNTVFGSAELKVDYTNFAYSDDEDEDAGAF
jgi:hypothetical protein